MFVSSGSASEQQILAGKIRHVVAEEMVEKSMNSLDLLLGILVFVSWYGSFQSLEGPGLLETHY